MAKKRKGSKRKTNKTALAWGGATPKQYKRINKGRKR